MTSEAEYSPTGPLELTGPVRADDSGYSYNFIAPDTQPTIWESVRQLGHSSVPAVLTVVLPAGVYLFRRSSRKFAEVM